MKPSEYLRVLWLEVIFPLGLTCYQWQVGTNSLKYGRIFLTTRELSVNRIDLQAPTLAGLPRTNLGAETPSSTTPRQPSIQHTQNLFFFHESFNKTDLISGTQRRYGL